MSIEGGASATSPKTATAENHGVKAKTPSGGEDAASAGGGFLAMLTALAPTVMVGAPDPAAQQPSEAADALAPPPALPVLLPQDLPNELALLLAQAGQGGADKAGSVSAGPAVRVRTGVGLAALVAGAEKPEPALTATATAGGGFLALLSALALPATAGAPDTAAQAPSEAAVALAPPPALSVLLPQDLPNELTLLLAQAGQGGADQSSALSDGPALRARPGAGLAALVAGAEKPEPALTATATAGAQGLGDLMQNADPLLDQTSPALAARTSKSGGAWLQSTASASLAESRTLNQFSPGDGAARAAALSETLVSSALGDSLLRQAGRATAKSSAAFDRTGVEGLWGQAGVPGASRADAPSVLTNPALPTLEAKVANTVSYWVTQGVQNAALKLDGLGDEPVEVNISLKGREAHIGFRTDQPEIRQILEGALVHLKNLLASEGLLLSGVSVGASGQDGKGTPQQQPRPGARPASIATPEAGSGQNQQRVAQVGGRAVDIFV